MIVGLLEFDDDDDPKSKMLNAPPSAPTAKTSRFSPGKRMDTALRKTECVSTLVNSLGGSVRESWYNSIVPPGLRQMISGADPGSPVKSPATLATMAVDGCKVASNSFIAIDCTRCGGGC